MASNAFITPNELQKSLNDTNLIIIDVSSYDKYKQSHIKNAIHSDVTKFIDKESPYSLMVPSKIIQEELKELGINSDSKVVIYSHNTKDGILKSSYLAFMLIYSGFENLTILDGGYMAWVFENELFTSKIIPKTKEDGNIVVDINKNIIASMKYIQNNLAIISVLDTRSTELYYGLKRSKGINAVGHIPYAKSSFYKDKFLKDGTIREQSQLDEIFIYGHELKISDEVIVYSDSALDASMEFYILYKHMGFKNAKLYEASLLEWGNKPDKVMRRFKWE